MRRQKYGESGAASSSWRPFFGRYRASWLKLLSPESTIAINLALLQPRSGRHGMRVRNAVLGIAVVISTVAVVPGASAHHSFAPHFDSSKPVSISGAVTMYEARNPHSYLHIAAVDESGRTREYVCESHGVTQLTR